jgi:hypothetical protein
MNREEKIELLGDCADLMREAGWTTFRVDFPPGEEDHTNRSVPAAVGVKGGLSLLVFAGTPTAGMVYRMDNWRQAGGVAAAVHRIDDLGPIMRDLL